MTVEEKIDLWTDAIICLVLAAVFVGSLGCAHVRPGVDTGARIDPGALDTAWRALGRTDAPPAVRVVVADCADARGEPGIRCGLLGHGACVQGCTLDPWSLTVVEGTGTAMICHEAAHVLLARDGVADPFHKTAIWGAPVAACKAAVASHEGKRNE